ncbi:hypothetical protein CFC21_083458 [Triticum aestivum]|uniref:WRKY19-like zinc finger domain-containing protein n=3 Tax=Triticum TaxID=4564 RepID=A0A9R0Y0C2_TRITD|nr:uncharacterized protein LOC119316886 [Triticum dicoccoides]XP_044403178.1 uncharacterized protein LOC123127514 [Triticum aestivum]KAF7079188.1 hypothetical protein CFC21_083458 [Triticum aestivum]VAI46323.1 unnamed protein product [Triticum turgidum subsp. durum]
MNNGYADMRHRGSQPLNDSSAVLMSGHLTPSYTSVGHGQTSFSLDFRGSAMDNCSRGNRSVQRSGHASAQDDACRLVLGLGPSPEPSSVDYQQPAGGAGKSKAPVTLFGRSLSFTNPGTITLGLHDQVGNAEAIAQHSEPPGGNIISFSGVDESSTSARRSSGGYIPSLLFASRPNLCVAQENRAEAHDDLLDDHTDNANDSAEHHLQFSPEPSATTMTETSFGVSSDVVTGVTDRGQPVHRRFPKKCRFKGCSKGARGASGLCIAHGGGQRCQKPGCYKGAESRTAYCKAHGGGRRCMQLGCTKSAEGKTDHCIAHGGGRRCGYNSCPKAARGKSGRCIKHGGGKRCAVEGCIRSAEGKVGFCISHGGGRRCQYPDCRKGAQGSTLYCKSHGGGKRCVFEGCAKGAEGSTPLCKAHGGGKRCMHEGGGVCPKSVHGGTNYCVAHGGGKRCAVPGCGKSARGRTEFCVKHGGGKRCKVDSCGKSAQGSTEFCKAHGGGKRCTFGTGCDKFARGRSGLCAAHATLVASQSQSHAQQRGRGGGSMIGPGLFRGIVSSSAAAAAASAMNYEYSSGVSTVSECDGSPVPTPGRQELIPPQVLVPLSMKSSSPSADRRRESGELCVPEGRVHGGGLLSLLGGSFRNVIDVDKLSSR